MAGADFEFSFMGDALSPNFALKPLYMYNLHNSLLGIDRQISEKF